MALGLLIPLAFVYLDIQQLEIDFNWLNIFEIVNSQNIYPVSFISFPILFGLICYAFVNIYNKSQELNEKNTFSTLSGTFIFISFPHIVRPEKVKS